MTTINFYAQYFSRASLAVAIAMCGVLAAGSAFGTDSGRYCSQTADAQLVSCQHEAVDDLFKARAICINLSDKDERKNCYAESVAVHKEDNQLCIQQLNGRRNLCTALGEARYDPDFAPADFGTDFTNAPHLNSFRPVKIGYQWEYAGGGEKIVIDVLNETKLIDDVNCVVVRDRVEQDGELIEDTNDWFAQAKNGDVWYCGEEVKDFDSFDGDAPRLPELVSIDGSFKAGRDGDKPGILFLGSPKRGAVYRQEFSASNAEDAVKVLSTTYSFGKNPKLDQFVPPALAQLFCAKSDCVVTRDFTPIDPAPKAIERKYYAKGVGLFFSAHEITGEGVQLVNCNFDQRCASLPTP